MLSPVNTAAAQQVEEHSPGMGPPWGCGCAKLETSSQPRVTEPTVSIAFQIWSFELASPLHELRGHSGCVRCSTFSEDGSLLATGDDNGEVRVECR